MPRPLTPVPLTASGFSTYGDVIEAGDGERRKINEGHTTRYHNLAALDLTTNGGQPGVNIFRSSPLPTPLILTLMERHPFSSQAFFPLGDSPYLVVVAPPGDLDPDKIVAFLAQPGQGVNYHRGTWHHYCLALDQESDFLVIDRIAEDENCDEIRLSDAEAIAIEFGEAR